MNDPSLKKVCIVGAGTMGCGIAANLRNVGFDVSLLDLTQEDVVTRIDQAKVAKPPLFYVAERAAEIRLGNIDDNFRWIAEADWVIEAVSERMETKSRILTQIGASASPSAILSTTTTGLSIESLSRAIPESIRSRFLGTHFLPPPRYQRLVEIALSTATDREVARNLGMVLEDRIGKRTLIVRDTPGFIATRIGVVTLLQNIRIAEELGLGIEQVDWLSGTFLDRPANGTFRRADQVGIDYLVEAADTIRERRPSESDLLTLPMSVVELAGRRWVGDRAGQGYYRQEAKGFLTFDLKTRSYQQGGESDWASLEDLLALPLEVRLAKGLELGTPPGEFLRRAIIPVLQHVHRIREEIADSVPTIDQAVEWGLGWSIGPFGLIDAIGAETVGIQATSFYSGQTYRGFDGAMHPIPDAHVYRPLAYYRVTHEVGSLKIRDLGDGVKAICLTNKMGLITPEVVAHLKEVISDPTFDRFVLTGEAQSFSAGYDLGWFLSRIETGKLEEIEEALAQFQHLGELLEQKHAVAAIHGHCLGGGLELALSCPRIVAAAECQVGFPEARVGLIPAGRGTTLMRIANQHNAKRLCETALNLIEGTIAPNAEAARSYGFLRSTDITCYHPDRLIHDAKKAVLDEPTLVRNEWNAVEGPLTGMIERAVAEAQRLGKLTEYDAFIGSAVRTVFAKSGSYAEGLLKERTAFLDLCGRALTQARIRHMIENKKPLRN